MKRIIFLVLVLNGFFSYAQKKSKEERKAILEQKKLEVKNKDTLIASNGMKFYKGAIIKLGVGSTDDGNFKFIRRNENSIFNYYGDDSQKVNAANSLPRNQSGYNVIIKRVENRGNKKKGYIKYAVFTLGIVNYEIDIENAINTGEVESSGIKNDKNKSSNNFSVADELSKLKKLFDDGVISKEEFDEQKKKLLERGY